MDGRIEGETLRRRGGGGWKRRSDSLRNAKISAAGKLAELAWPSTFQDYQRENYGREGGNVAVVANRSLLPADERDFSIESRTTRQRESPAQQRVYLSPLNRLQAIPMNRPSWLLIT